jgi:hypothetical protein
LPAGRMPWLIMSKVVLGWTCIRIEAPGMSSVDGECCVLMMLFLFYELMKSPVSLHRGA